MRKIGALLLFGVSLLVLTTPSFARAAEDENPVTAQEVEALVRQARRGNAHAQYKLAKAYETGSGTRQSYSEAVRWYKAAAHQGLARAQFSLGLIFEEGRPEVKRDVAYALSWYEEAARNGLTAALEHIRRMTTSH